MKAADKFTHIDNLEDKVYLKTKAFPVNIKLFNSNAEYHSLIQACIAMVRRACLYTYEDYKKPHGMSGANLAIPFNIIGVIKNRNKKNEYVKILINPEFIPYKHRLIKKCVTNCGSIRLDKPIKVKRFTSGTVKYFDELGNYHKEFIVEDIIYTIQHEIDHNNGILITDRV